ncbi:MAG: glycoside hydrolase family 99-like domain-containing protein [Alphaproteobacteria bacterium]|nr:glycoside hydrolase family 99-like domain-containing protein [Alphaproteobacteria bacterium]
MENARLIAFYLPQFHPIPENDRWWGTGFTEWTNVTKARPLYRGHDQPRLPADLGFYDLRVPEVRAAQADLARACGIEGFCYWHYWFGDGRRILERPFAEVLSTGQPDFPFCLAWANQSWSGVWHGDPQSVLIRQGYPGPDDEAAHFRWASSAFRDPRYMRVDGKPIFVVYAPHDLPSTGDFVGHWRALATEAGLPGIYFVAVSTAYRPGLDIYHDPILAPFDAVTPLTPQDFLWSGPGRRSRTDFRRRWRERDFGWKLRRLTKKYQRPARFEYDLVVNSALESMPDEARFLPCVLPNWDNTPRSGVRGVVFENATPDRFARYLAKAVSRVRERNPETAIVFIKAWNEWAEGNYLEPDLTYGRGYLDAVRAVMTGSEPSRARQSRALAGVLAAPVGSRA